MSVGFMEARALLRKPGALPDIARVALLVVGSLLFLSLFHSLVRAYYKTLAPHSMAVAALPVIITAGIALILYRERYAQFSPVLRIALRSSCAGLLAYLLVEPPDLTLISPEFAGDYGYIEIVYYLALACAAASVLMPAFVVPVAIYIVSARHLSEGISGLITSTLDIHYMVDMALYLGVFAIGLVRLGSKLPHSELRGWQEDIAFVAFGLHLGNYFWSAIAKAVAGPYFWTWTLENQTQTLVVYALDKGTLPFGHGSPWLIQLVYDAMQLAIVPLNLAIFGFQLFAVICVLRLSWLRISTIFYDLFHIGIYVLGGLFFWPWIWNNFTILLAANRLSTISNSAKAACILTILLGNPLFGLYRAARLGWFDVADARQINFVAVTDTQRARVPASFFLTHSFAVSLGYVDSAEHPEHYGSTPWNATRDYNRQLTSGTCPSPEASDRGKFETERHRKRRLERIGEFLRAHHRKMLDREAAFGKFSYYYRVHHHPSNPYLFEDFSALELKDVRAYELEVESACYQLKDGHLIKKVVGKTVDRFDVQ